MILITYELALDNIFSRKRNVGNTQTSISNPHHLTCNKYTTWKVCFVTTNHSHKNLLSYSANCSTRKIIFVFLTKNYGHLSLPSYKIFISDEAGLLLVVKGKQAKITVPTFLKSGKQNCNIFQWKEDQEQPLSVHLWAKKGFYLKKKTKMPRWWQPLQAAKCSRMQPWSAIVKVTTLLSAFNQWEFSVSKKTGNSLFSKDVYSPSVPTPNQVKSSILCWHSVLLQFPPRVQGSNKNTRKWRAVNSLGIGWRTNHV